MFPYNRGEGFPIVRCPAQPALHNLPDQCCDAIYQVAEKTQGCVEFGRDMPGALCSTAHADGAVFEIATDLETEAPCTRRVPQFGVSSVFSLCGDMQNQ